MIILILCPGSIFIFCVSLSLPVFSLRSPVLSLFVCLHTSHGLSVYTNTHQILFKPRLSLPSTHRNRGWSQGLYTDLHHSGRTAGWITLHRRRRLTPEIERRFIINVRQSGGEQAIDCEHTSLSLTLHVHSSLDHTPRGGTERRRRPQQSRSKEKVM